MKRKRRELRLLLIADSNRQRFIHRLESIFEIIFIFLQVTPADEMFDKVCRQLL